MKRSVFVSLLLTIIVGVAGGADAGTPEWRYGGRILWVSAGTTSGELGTTGSHLDLSSGPGLEFDATVMFSDVIGIELSVGVSGHRLDLVGGDWDGIDGGWVGLVPLTALAQYHLQVYGPWDPYFGLGITWIGGFSSLSSDFQDAGVEDLDLKGGAGLAAQIGTNYQMNNRWYANVDLRYLGASLDATVRTDEGDLPTVKLDIKPWVFAIGCGYKF
ncbi:MAG: OmpW family protein [Acidobacteria bacterium]|nr:OmpW family protein [Candidatus Sulfomarinibacter sp. MAG AM1]